MTGSKRPAEVAKEHEVSPDAFDGLFARLELFALSGAPSVLAVCISARPHRTTVRSLVDPEPFCTMVMTLHEGEVWPHPERRRTTILESHAGGPVLWLFPTSAAAQAVLPMLRQLGATIQAAGTREGAE